MSKVLFERLRVLEEVEEGYVITMGFFSEI